MKKILVGFLIDGKTGGIDNYLMNFLDAVKDWEVQADFLANDRNEELEKALEECGSTLYAIANLKRPLKQFQQVCQILEKGKYEIVYLNISTAIDCIAAMAAKRCGVKKIVLHSHSSGNDCENAVKRWAYNGIHYCCRTFLYKKATHFYGCSEKAGEWMYPSKIVRSDQFQVIFNTVDRQRFAYSKEIRDAVRKELGLENTWVIGHVGTFCYQKNHEFLIRVFAEISKKVREARLLLLGNGVRMRRVKEQTERLGISEKVLFLGWRPDAERIFQAMDLFLLPSNFEGLPTVGIEAQCCGLTCIFSDTITKETAITDRCYFKSLKEPAEKWAQFILEHREMCAEELRDRVRYTVDEQIYGKERQLMQFREIIE